MADTEADSVVFIPPSYACDEKKKDGFVRVIVAAKNLSTTREIIRKGLLPKTVKKPSNAKVSAVFENQSMCVTVRGEQGGIKGKNYQLKINQLPYEIDPDKSYHEVEDDRVLVYLNKKQDKSWYPELDNGLETAEDEEGDQS